MEGARTLQEQALGDLMRSGRATRLAGAGAYYMPEGIGVELAGIGGRVLSLTEAEELHRELSRAIESHIQNELRFARRVSKDLREALESARDSGMWSSGVTRALELLS